MQKNRATSYFDSFGSLDRSITYAVNTHASVTLSGVNLLRSPLRQYGLTPAGTKVPGEVYAYGRTLAIGMQVKF